MLGKIRCGHCKRSLIRIDCTTIPYFICKKAEYEDNTECIGERLSEPELEIAILECINEELEQGILEGGNQCQKSDTDFPVMDHKQIRKMCKALEQKQDSLKIEKQYLYEQYKRKQMERKTYLNRVGALREEERRLSEQIQNLQKQREQCEEEDRTQPEKARHNGKLEILTREMVDEWIEAIYVYGKSQFDIVYKEKIKKSKKSIKNC